MAALVCCELVKRGRFVAAEPYFEGGQLISLAHAKRYAADVGSLAVIAASRTVGRVVEVLGGEDDIHAVLRGLLAENGAFGEAPPLGSELGDPPREVQAQLDSLGPEIPFLEQREDLRTQLCFTIDPPDARDHDDAVAIEDAPDGSGLGWIVWVHIADVSAWVTPGSPLDLHAVDLALSTYVPGAVAPMLPHRLSSDLCSLRPGVDRGCVSVRLELKPDAQVAGVRFARTVIRSARRLSYDEVDEVLAGRSAIDPLIDDRLLELDRLARLLRSRRVERGALDMSMPELEFDLGEREPLRAHMSPESPSHRLIEECMLLANNAVGERLARANAPAIFRVHDHPDPLAIEHLVEMFERLGVPTPALPEQFSGAQAARLAAEIARMAQRYSEQRGRGRLTFPPRVLRALQQAQYRAHTGVHSGLATEDYLHFTSPIRRYPDLVNHRSLLALIGASHDAASTIDLETVAEHVSFTERASMQVERSANDIVLAHLLHRRLYVDGDPGSEASDDGSWKGEVIGVIKSGAFVRFGKVFDGFLPARTLAPDERYELDDHGIALVSTSSGKRLQLGDPVDVYVHKINRAAGKVELRRVGSVERDDDQHARRGTHGGSRGGGRRRGGAYRPRGGRR